MKQVATLAAFFSTRRGLWVSEEFKERILVPALKMPETAPAPAAVGRACDLPKDMTNTQILEKIDQKVFEDSYSFLLYLAGALERQWGGMEGDLLNNGYANIFYVRGLRGEVFTVYVYWYADYGEWYVGACRLDGRHWGQGDRAFPSNC